MSRRRLKVYYSSSDDEDPDHHPPPPPPPPPPQPSATPIVIDDEDDIEDFDSMTLNSPNPTPIQIDPPPPDDTFSPPPASDCPIGLFLERLGLRLRREWVDGCLRGLEGSVSGFRDLDVGAKAKLCFRDFLFSDMNFSGAGILPENVHRLHLVDLAGPFVLQVDEIVNMSCPLKGRYQAMNSGIKRCLKLSMTDGVQRVYGMEYRPIKDLQVLDPAGLKIVIRNVHVRRGILMLVPEVIEVLGGLVEDLEAARQRLVQEVNKPPRGKRTRNGVVPPLATRATDAAWSPNSLNGSGPTSTTTSQSAGPPRTAEPGSAPGFHTRERTSQEFAYVPDNRTILEPDLSTPLVDRRANVESIVSSAAENSWNNTEPTVASTAGNRRASIESNLSSTAEYSRANSESNPSSTSGNIMTDSGLDQSSASGNNRVNVDQNLSSTATPDVEEIHMADEADYPAILKGDMEFPFTYIASLSAKLAAMEGRTSYVQGAIKCFMTGVKAFLYKQRAKYELRAYVDDGSLISEILVDHNVVQKKIGHSPQEVTAALSSSDSKRVNQMKDVLKQFQIFLVNFEGTMLVQISEDFPVPIAVEMDQGCTSSDAWLLLRRLKSFIANPPKEQPQIEPINVSP